MARGRNWARHTFLLILLVVASVLCACGDDDDKPAATGVVTETWSQYCVATFSADYAVVDPWDDPMFTAKSGEQYLLSRFTMGFLEEDKAELLYLTAAGPIDFEVSVPSGESFPFTSNCAADSVTSHVGVFNDTTVYAEVELRTAVCELTQGTVGSGSSLNYSFAGDNLLEPRAPYQISFGDAFAQQCPGVTEGFVRSGSHMMAGTQYSVIPLASFIGP